MDSKDIAHLFHALGLDRPGPVRVLAAQHQIAQKIHACTEPGSFPAHDLVDLLSLWPRDRLEFILVAETTRRLCAYRKLHPFPGICIPGPDWAVKYDIASEGLEVIKGVDQAAAWLNHELNELTRRS